MSLNMKVKFGIAVAIVSTAIGVAYEQQPQPETRASVCELVRRGSAMTGRRIRVTAIYETDFRHGAVLRDPKCPDAVLRLRYFSGKPRDKSLDDFEQAQRPRAEPQPPYYSRASILRVEASGEFAWDPTEELPGKLVMDKIWQFKEIPGGRVPKTP